MIMQRHILRYPKTFNTMKKNYCFIYSSYCSETIGNWYCFFFVVIAQVTLGLIPGITSKSY